MFKYSFPLITIILINLQLFLWLMQDDASSPSAFDPLKSKSVGYFN